MRADGEPAQPAIGESLVRSAQSFTGLAYLWAGQRVRLRLLGLTSLVHRVHGLTIRAMPTPSGTADGEQGARAP